ncbi:MAG: hypothetical protein WBA63_13160 [Thermomicrobiales bacterium]
MRRAPGNSFLFMAFTAVFAILVSLATPVLTVAAQVGTPAAVPTEDIVDTPTDEPSEPPVDEGTEPEGRMRSNFQ